MISYGAYSYGLNSELKSLMPMLNFLDKPELIAIMVEKTKFKHLEKLGRLNLVGIGP